MHVTRFPTSILLCLATWLVVPVVATAETKPNVLLFAVDDLNDWVGCLAGHPDTRTPNIDRLAGSRSQGTGDRAPARELRKTTAGLNADVQSGQVSYAFFDLSDQTTLFRFRNRVDNLLRSRRPPA
jgi:hypothetical protein